MIQCVNSFICYLYVSIGKFTNISWKIISLPVPKSLNNFRSEPVSTHFINAHLTLIREEAGLNPKISCIIIKCRLLLF